MDPIPGTEKITFKEGFIERYSKLTDWSKFKRCSLSYLSRAIRVNTLKGTVVGVKNSIEEKNWKLKKIPWCKEGFWVEHSERRDIGNLLEHHLGKIYVQEAASMIPPLVLRSQPGELVLDMCASPGSKATQIAAMMKNEGLLVANDVSGLRLQALGINLQRCGVTNVLITLGNGFRFKGFSFDRILVDAPCSATGTIMRSLKTIGMWNPKMVGHLCRVQKKLLEVAFANLKKGGTLVYSTCTMEPEEDEGVVSSFLDKHNGAQLDVINEKELPGLKRGKAILGFGGKEYNSEVKKCLRIWPQDNKTEGFFVARLRKE